MSKLISVIVNNFFNIFLWNFEMYFVRIKIPVKRRAFTPTFDKIVLRSPLENYIY